MSAAGLLAVHHGKLTFVPQSAVRSLVRAPKIEPLPDPPPGVLGYAMVHGEVVLVVSVGPERDDLVVSDWFGETLGIAGLTPHRVGVFEEAPGGILVDGSTVPTFDLNHVAMLLLRTQRSA